MFSFLHDFFSSPSSTSTDGADGAPMTPAAVPYLPLEIVLNIIEEAHTDHDHTHFLKQCALVCRDWSIPAQKLLFSSVHLATRTSCDAFLAAVDPTTPRGRMFADSVQRMKVVLDHNQPLGLSQQSFAHAVTACPNLLELNLALYGRASSPVQDLIAVPDLLRSRRPAQAFSEATLDLLKAAGPRITALHFSNWSESHHSVVELLDVWPSLKTLTIGGLPPKLPAGCLGPFPCALEGLRMNFQTSPSVDFVKWLLHNSTSSLRVLELERESSPELLEYLVDEHRESLCSLALPACTSHDHAYAVRKCERLRELRIENPWVTPLLYKRLPAGIEHMALALDQDAALQPMLDTARASRSLKAITLQVWENGERHPQLPVLKLVCAHRGIDLRITKDIQQFRSTVRNGRTHMTFHASNKDE